MAKSRAEEIFSKNPKLKAQIDAAKQEPARTKHPKTEGLNNLETGYYHYLKGLKEQGAIMEFWVHPGSLRLGHDRHYRPDFLVQLADRLEYHETKGEYFREDSKEKIRNAAREFWTIRFVIVRFEAKSEGELRSWTFEEVKP